MKKILPYLILLLCALLLWDLLLGFGDTSFHIDGEEFDGPLGALLGLVFASGGALIGVLVTVLVAVVLAVVFAGVGLAVLGALGIAGIAVLGAMVPLLLPLLVPVAIVWYLVSRSRRNADKHPVAVTPAV